MADWVTGDGGVERFLGGARLGDIVDDTLGIDATYTAPGGAQRELRGTIVALSDTIEDLTEYVGRIDSRRRFKIQRRATSVQDFPPDPAGATYGQLAFAGQAYGVVGVAYHRATHILLFLTDPL